MWRFRAPLLAALLALLALSGVGGAGPSFAVYTRVYHDTEVYPYFIQWYLGLGFTRIIVLQADFANGVVYPQDTTGRVTLIPVSDTGDGLLATHQYLFMQHQPNGTDRQADTIDWVLAVDFDELLVINKPTISEYVVDAISRTTSPNGFASFHFRWAMVQRLEPWCGSLPFAVDVLSHGIQQQNFMRMMVNLSATTGIYDSHRFNLKRSYMQIWRDGTSRSFPGRRPKAAWPVTNTAFSDSAMLHLTPRSVASMLIRKLVAVGNCSSEPSTGGANKDTTRKPRPARPARVLPDHKPGCSSAALGFSSAYGQNVISLIALIRQKNPNKPQIGPRHPPDKPPPAPSAAQATAALSSAAKKLQAFVVAYGVKSAYIIEYARDIALWERTCCAYTALEMSRRITRLLYASKLPVHAPVCNRTMERARLLPMLADLHINENQADAFTEEIADAYELVSVAMRRDPPNANLTGILTGLLRAHWAQKDD